MDKVPAWSELLRNQIKGKGHSIVSAAVLMNISRTSLYTYLNEQVPPEKLVQLVKDKFDIEIPVAEDIPTKIISHKDVGESEISNTFNESGSLFGPTKLSFMAHLLKLSLQELSALAKKEVDVEKVKLIHEVYDLKQQLDHLRKENDMLREHNDFLKNNKRK